MPIERQAALRQALNAVGAKKMSVREAAVKHGARAAFNVLAAASMYPLLVRDMLPTYGSAAADVRMVTLLSAHGVPGAPCPPNSKCYRSTVGGVP